MTLKDCRLDVDRIKLELRGEGGSSIAQDAITFAREHALPLAAGGLAVAWLIRRKNVIRLMLPAVLALRSPVVQRVALSGITWLVGAIGQPPPRD